MNDLIPFSMGIDTFKNQVAAGTLSWVDVFIENEFTRQKIDFDYFKINIGDGKLSFEVPFGYLHNFIQKTVMSSDNDLCMESASYNVLVHFVYRGQKGTVIFESPSLLSSNNYGPEEGHQFLLQATTGDLKIEKGWI